MSLASLFDRRGYWIGPFAALYAWVVILAAAARNPQWSVFSQALSYLGAGTAVDPWLYDYVGMVPTGLMILTFAYYLYRASRNRTQRIGSAHLVLGGLLLVGIGIWHQGPGAYPPGTSPSLGQNLHDLFSAWFFLQALLAALTWGVGLRREERFPLGSGLVAATLGAWGVAVFIGLAFGPWTGAAPLHSTLLQRAGEGGIGVGAAIAVLGGLLAWRSVRGQGREAWGIYLLLVGALLAGIGAVAGFGDIPGGVGEVIGIVAIDLFVGLMFFARRDDEETFSLEFPSRALLPEEKVQIKARRSLLHAFQVPALASALLGMFLFFYGVFYLNGHLVGLILGTVKVQSIIGPVLSLYLSGYLLVVLAAWRWSVAISDWTGRTLLVAVVLVPLLMVASWFDTDGDVAMLGFFLAAAVALPLLISLWNWHRTRYALTDRRALLAPASEARELSQLTRPEISGLAVRRGLFHRWFDVGDVLFSSGGGEPSGRASRKLWRVVWVGVPHPREVMEKAASELHVGVVKPRRRRLRPVPLLVAMAFVVPAVLLVSAVPVLSVTSTVELPCAYLLGDLQAVEHDPWPYLHNMTVPIGEVALKWWSGTDVYVLVVQLPVGLAYQNVPLNTSSGSLPTGLTTSGNSSYMSYGGDSAAACISLSANTVVVLQLTYASPLIWS